MVNYLESFAEEEKSYDDVLKNVPVAVVGFMMGLYLVLIISAYYINRDNYEVANRLEK